MKPSLLILKSENCPQVPSPLPPVIALGLLSSAVAIHPVVPQDLIIIKNSAALIPVRPASQACCSSLLLALRRAWWVVPFDPADLSAALCLLPVSPLMPSPFQHSLHSVVNLCDHFLFLMPGQPLPLFLPLTLACDRITTLINPYSAPGPLHPVLPRGP